MIFFISFALLFCISSIVLSLLLDLFMISSGTYQGWRMVKFKTRQDAEILVRNPSPRLFGKKFRDSKKVKTNHAKTRLRDLSKTLPRFRDPAKIFLDPRFSRYHSPPLILPLVLWVFSKPCANALSCADQPLVLSMVARFLLINICLHHDTGR